MPWSLHMSLDKSLWTTTAFSAKYASYYCVSELAHFYTNYIYSNNWNHIAIILSWQLQHSADGEILTFLMASARQSKFPHQIFYKALQCLQIHGIRCWTSVKYLRSQNFALYSTWKYPWTKGCKVSCWFKHIGAFVQQAQPSYLTIWDLP